MLVAVLLHLDPGINSTMLYLVGCSGHWSDMAVSNGCYQLGWKLISGLITSLSAVESLGRILRHNHNL